jgi:hypothetical protein
MAGAGHKLWAAGDVVGASGDTDINTALLQQVVGVYAASANRDAAFGGAGEPTLSEGLFCFLNDTNEFQVYTGSAWVTIGDPDALVVDSANARVGINSDTPLNRLMINDGTDITPTNSAVGQLGIVGNGYSGYVAMNATAMYIGHNIATRNLVLQTNETDILQVLATGKISIPVSGANLGMSTSSPGSMPTTIQAANLYFYSTDGRLYWNSSSERNKTDVEDVEDAYADKVLDLRPVWFRSACEIDRKDWGHWGFIAEEVDLVDPRLVSYGPIPRVGDDGEEITGDDGVTLNELDADGENVLRPENVQYDRIIPLLVNVIKRQEARIAALEAAA